MVISWKGALKHSEYLTTVVLNWAEKQKDNNER